MSHAVYVMLTEQRLAHRTVSAMLWEAMSWKMLESYPQHRERWIATATAWAETGREDCSSVIVCAMAQAFQATRPDGEYGDGATCADDAEGVDLVRTGAWCPVCEAPEPTAATSVCRPETLEAGQPTCETAGGYPTCVGSFAVTSARAEDLPLLVGALGRRDGVLEMRPREPLPRRRPSARLPRRVADGGVW